MPYKGCHKSPYSNVVESPIVTRYNFRCVLSQTSHFTMDKSRQISLPAITCVIRVDYLSRITRLICGWLSSFQILSLALSPMRSPRSLCCPCPQVHDAVLSLTDRTHRCQLSCELKAKNLFCTKNDDACNPILELSRVSRPSPLPQNLKSGLAQLQLRFPIDVRQLSQQVITNERDVLPAFPQRRQLNPD